MAYCTLIVAVVWQEPMYNSAMKNIVEAPNEEKFIFTEGIDYLTTGDKSIWGEGDEETWEILKNYKFTGKWLNLAAGDGRYNNEILKQATEIVATDIDQSALAKLEWVTPKELVEKLVTKRMDLHDVFPFGDQEFDGVFCVGTLHLFPEDKLEKIFIEINRIVKNGGNMFIDFATDISRLLPDGSQRKKTYEASYTTEEAENIFRKNFPGFNLTITRHKVPEETVTIGKLSYIFSCNYILMRGEKVS
jgi:SAM-dependent methyltransferase